MGKIDNSARRYKKPENFRMNVLGATVRALMDMDFNRHYNETIDLTKTEKAIYAGNIATKIREVKEYSGGNETILALVSGILEIDLNDLEMKVTAVSKGISNDEAREMISRYKYNYFRT